MLVISSLFASFTILNTFSTFYSRSAILASNIPSAMSPLLLRPSVLCILWFLLWAYILGAGGGSASLRLGGKGSSSEANIFWRVSPLGLDMVLMVSQPSCGDYSREHHQTKPNIIPCDTGELRLRGNLPHRTNAVVVSSAPPVLHNLGLKPRTQMIPYFQMCLNKVHVLKTNIFYKMFRSHFFPSVQNINSGETFVSFSDHSIWYTISFKDFYVNQ